MDLNILPECYVDTNLIETIVPPSSRYNHQKGCGTVAKVMKEKLSDLFAVGIIDKDKQQLDYLREFNLIIAKGSLELFKHSSRHHYIIRICPAVEAFILHNATVAGIALSDFNLPTDLDNLRKISKSTTSKDDHRFKGLFRVLMQQGTHDIRLLTSWLRYLKQNKYQVDCNAFNIIE